MARKNDSSKMKPLLQPDLNKSDDKPGAEVAAAAGGGHVCSLHSRSSECGASCTAVRRQRVEGSQVALACCPLQQLKRQCDVQLGELSFSDSHTVLIDVNVFRSERLFVAQDGRDIWRSNFVKMPCSHSSSITKSGLMGPSLARRWDVISKHLKALASKSEVDVGDVQKAIMKYNPKYEKQWVFDGLVDFVKLMPKGENYFHKLFPKIAALALKLPDHVKKAVPLLSAGRTAAITLSQVQISCLLANAFFCTFPHRNTSGPNTEYYSYPSINFSSLFRKASRRKMEKLRAIMHYFKQVTDVPPDGLVTFQRRCLSSAEMPNWTSSKEKLPKLHITSQGSIDTDGTGLLQVDFAASLVGGGVLNTGLLQEEILFLICPELIVSRLFTEKLQDNECLIITGCQRFSLYSGFSDSFEWAGPCDDTVGRDKWQRRQRQIVAMDALHFKHNTEQYHMAKVTRELNKAYCGFKKDRDDEPDVATGKWGCGAFNGDPQLKALIQLMAAAQASRGLAFFTFEDQKVKHDVEEMYNLLCAEDATVGELYKLIERYCKRKHHGSQEDLLAFIFKMYRSSRSLL